MKKLTFSILIFGFLAVNAAVQDAVLNRLNLNSNSQSPDPMDGKQVSTDILFTTPLDERRDWKISVPKLATFEKGNKDVYPNVWELLETAGKLDVLFVGDSTISWGFDYHQFELNSGLKAASLSFGLNTPDIFLARMTSLLTRCEMNPGGIVILSYSYGVSMGHRRNRGVDKYLKSFSRDGLDCEDYRRELARAKQKSSGGGKGKTGWVSVLSNRALYDGRVLKPLEAFFDRLLPLKSARIGVKGLVARIQNKPAAKEGNVDFLRWDRAFRVPINSRRYSWEYHPLDRQVAKKTWDRWLAKTKPARLRILRDHLSVWNKSYLSVPVCTAIPLSINNEDVRYWQWKELGTSECLINFGEVMKRIGKMDTLGLQSGKHFINDSGLIMAAVLGKYFKINENLLDDIHNARPIGDGIVFLREQ